MSALEGFRFADPTWLGAGLLGPLVVAAVLWRERRGRAIVFPGLATALTRLRRSQAKSRVVVLVTDGANNAGEIDPATAADVAKAMEVRVYTICVGRGGRVPMPVQVQDPFSGRIVKQTAMVQVDIDEALLQRIADRTGGEFFRATDAGSLKAIFDRIDHLEKSEIRLTAYQRYRELFPPVLLTALGAIASAGLLFVGGLRVAPV